MYSVNAMYQPLLQIQADTRAIYKMSIGKGIGIRIGIRIGMIQDDFIKEGSNHPEIAS